jgi:formate hydrogenlyase subunit 4
MSIVLPVVAQLLHVALVLAAAPVIAGLADWLDARLVGRAGPPVLQPWRDLLRLVRKTPVSRDNTAAVSRLAPVVGLSVTLSAAALVPSFTLGMALSPLADMLVIVSFLTLARIVAAGAAFDSGVALPGLAAQQASALAVLAEPALMVVAFTLALMGGSFNLDTVMLQQREGLLLPATASAVALAALLGLVFVDIDAALSAIDQTFTGTDLALSRLSIWLRRVIWFDLIGGLFLPLGMATVEANLLDWLIGLVCWTTKISAFTLGLASFQSFVGRVHPRGTLDLLGVAALLALLAAIMVLASGGIV